MSFTSAARLVVWTTTILGIVVSLAPAVPFAALSIVLFSLLVGWTVAVAVCTGTATIAAWSRIKLRTATTSMVLALAGLSVAFLVATQLEVIRIVYRRPELVWNVDWRFAWSHAQSIARFGGTSDSLDYSGTPLDYHVGPVWLAAVVERLFGSGMTLVLFGIVPALSMLAAAIAMIVLLADNNGVRRERAAAAVGVAFCLPLELSAVELVQGLPGALLDADGWLFANGMLGSLFAASVGLCSLAIMIDRRRPLAGIVGAVGVSALVQLKPQFFVAFAMLGGVIGIARWRGSTPFGLSSAALLLNTLGAAALAAGLMAWLPGLLPVFSTPVLAAGSTGYSVGDVMTELAKPAAIVAGLTLLAWPAARVDLRRRATLKLPSELFGCVVTGFVLLVLLLAFVSVPLRDDIVARAQLLGFDFPATDAQQDVAQALIPLRLILAASALASLAILAKARNRRAERIVASIAMLTIASPLPMLARNFWAPASGYEAAEEEGLFEALQLVPLEGELLIASDLADPADDFERQLRGFLLTAYGGHRFYLSNLWYWNWVRPDSPERLASVRAFFGAPWSDWHSAWLAQARVTHVLISERCIPGWFGRSDNSLRVVVTSHGWTLLETLERPLNVGTLSEPSALAMTPRFGQAPCL
jgi:hypothetical protein